MSLADLISKTLNEVQNNPGLIINASSFEPMSFDTERLAASFEENTGITIRPAEKELLNFPGETHLSWRSKNNAELIPAGAFRIVNIENALLEKKNAVPIHNDDISPETLNLLKQSYYFDTFPEFTWDIATVLHYDKKEITFKLFFMDKLELHPLDCGLIEYIEMCMLTKGMYYWQYLFCSSAVQKNVTAYKRAYVDSILPFLKTDFPGNDYSSIESKYNSWHAAIAK